MDQTLTIPATLRLAAFTLDVEHDYGSRTGRFEALRDAAGVERLQSFLGRRGIPVSAFAVSSLLDQEPAAVEFLRALRAEVHSHSHTHGGEETEKELMESQDIIRRLFPQGPIGYRAPHGRVDAEQVQTAKRLGYAFSSSVFPSLRPGVFNNLASPLTPYRHANGLVELPFAVVRGVRLIVSVSYIKLFGWGLFERLMGRFGLPPVAVIDSHLHDFLDTPSYRLLPAPLRLAWGVNRMRGIEFAGRLADFLARRGYTFVTMNEIVRRLQPPGEGGS